MPSSLQARRMRSAISPRLAMRILSNMALRLFDDDAAARRIRPAGRPRPGSRVTVPARGAGIWFMVFIASMISSVWPSVTVSPTSTKGSAPGSGAQIGGADHRRLDTSPALAGVGGCGAAGGAGAAAARRPAQGPAATASRPRPCDCARDADAQRRRARPRSRSGRSR